MRKTAKVSRVCTLRLAVLRRSIARLPALMTLGVALLVPSVALSEPVTVNCHDLLTALICNECFDQTICALCVEDALACLLACDGNETCEGACHRCTEVCGYGYCCSGPCTVIEAVETPPPPPLLPLTIKTTVGSVSFVYQRKNVTKDTQPLVAIKLQEAVRFSGGKKSLKVQTVLGGGDALVGSLLYPVVFLGNGQNAINVLRSFGYDVSLAGAAPKQTCQDISSQTECTLHAFDLARQLRATLTAAAAPELGAFEVGIQALGAAGLGIKTTTTVTTTTSTTTSTAAPAMCPTDGSTDPCLATLDLGGNLECAQCCAQSGCANVCAADASTFGFCDDAYLNSVCAFAINLAGCASVCCPTPTTTTSTTTTTTIPPPSCPGDGSSAGCSAFQGVPACATCCLGKVCENQCGQAVGSSCTNGNLNVKCDVAIDNSGCASVCCP